MSESKAPKPPESIRTEPGRALWESIAGKYAFRPDEIARLESACLTADMVHRLETTWFELGMPMVTLGSMKQEVIHPLIGELRMQRAALDGALIRLKLPDEAGEGQERANQQRDAANSRWATGRGA